MTKSIAKIIHIMNHPPAYLQYANTSRPNISWDTPSGSWVGIWGSDWADLLSIEIKKINNRINHEIWQPDIRADKIYSSEIFPGVVHRLFPAIEKQKWIGLKKTKILVSKHMLRFINFNQEYNTIFHIGKTITNSIYSGFLYEYPSVKVVLSFHGEIRLPINNLYKIQKNILAKLFHFNEHLKHKKLYKQISYLTYQTDEHVDQLNFYYRGKKEKITMGIGFSNYQGYDKLSCRKELILPISKKVLCTLSLITPNKQIDKLISVLSAIEFDFLFIVIGNGTIAYENYLKKKASQLIAKKKILFVGRKDGIDKVKYLAASDLFIHVSKSEAGPVVNMEAMACGLPILTTKTGNTAEFLIEQDAGCIVEKENYSQWKLEIEKFLSGNPITPVNVSIAKNRYDWSSIAHRFNNIYMELFS